MVLDTNIIIAYINGEARVNQRLARLQKEGVSLFISPITFAEVLSLPKVDPAEVEQITRFLQSFLSIPFDNQLAQSAAYLRRVYQLTLPDAAIAATAINLNLPLLTRDKDFRRIKELTLLEMTTKSNPTG